MNQNNRNTRGPANADPMDAMDDDGIVDAEYEEAAAVHPSKPTTAGRSGSGISLFGDFDDKAADEYAEQAERDRGAGKFLKLKEGKTMLRFMPPAKGERVPFKTMWEHNIELPGGKVSFACPRNNFKLACPACQQESALMAQGMEERAKGFKAKKRHYANVIVRGEEEMGPRILGFGYSIEEDLMAFRRDAGVNFSHPIDGVDIIISRKGTTQFDTEYKVMLDPKGPRPLAESDARMAELAEAMYDLNTVTRQKTATEIVELLQGGGSRGGNGGGRVGSGEQTRGQLGGGAAGALRGGNGPRR